MPSITVWNQLHPWSQAAARGDVRNGLAAQVRDPLWLLTRQWQLGEFTGANAASPAAVEIQSRTATMSGWRVADSNARWTPLDTTRPIEATLLAEPSRAYDLMMAVECGQLFERWLQGDLTLAPLLQAFRDAYPFPDPDPTWARVDRADRESLRFAKVFTGRVLDGLRLLYDAVRAPTDVVGKVTGAAANAPALQDLLNQYAVWGGQTVGRIGESDPVTWARDRLEYRAEVAVQTNGPVLATTPDRQGVLDWYAFDAISVGGKHVEAESATQFVVPTHVRFRGMPNERWWDFERGSTDFGAVQLGTTDLGTMLLADFMLVHGHDWFVAHFPLPVGTVCWIDLVRVHDVFGGVTALTAIDEAATSSSGSAPWTMFSASMANNPKMPAGFFVQPPSATTALMESDAIEDVRFLRDETADMIWAVEHSTPGLLGVATSGFEQNQASKPALPTPPSATDPDIPISYQIQNEVPQNWFPFLPIMTAAEVTSGRVTLQQGAVLNDSGDTSEIPPLGGILACEGSRYLLEEEEVPRSGVQVTRIRCRSRWTDGSTYVWVERRRAAGQGEGASGLKFDTLVPNE